METYPRMARHRDIACVPPRIEIISMLPCMVYIPIHRIHVLIDIWQTYEIHISHKGDTVPRLHAMKCLDTVCGGGKTSIITAMI